MPLLTGHCGLHKSDIRFHWDSQYCIWFGMVTQKSHSPFCRAAYKNETIAKLKTSSKYYELCVVTHLRLASIKICIPQHRIQFPQQHAHAHAHKSLQDLQDSLFPSSSCFFPMKRVSALYSFFHFLNFLFIELVFIYLFILFLFIYLFFAFVAFWSFFFFFFFWICRMTHKVLNLSLTTVPPA